MAMKKIIQAGIKAASSKGTNLKKGNPKAIKREEYKEPTFEQKRDSFVRKQYEDTTDGRMKRYEKLLDLYQASGKKPDDALKRIKDSVFKVPKEGSKKSFTGKYSGGMTEKLFKEAAKGVVKKRTTKKAAGGKVSKPKGCGAATRGYGKAMKGNK